MSRIRTAQLGAWILIVGSTHLACSDLDRNDDPLNYHTNCVYTPAVGPVGERFIVNDFGTSTAAVPDTACFGTGSACLAQIGATACTQTRANTFGWRIGPFCSVSPPGKICVNYAASPEGGDYLSLAFDVAGADSRSFSGYVEKLGDSSAGWFNLRALNYRALTFLVRVPFGSVVAEIALKSADGAQTTPKPTLDKYIPNAGAEWTRVSIPIADLMVNAAGPNECVDLERLGEFNIAFPRRWDESLDATIPKCGVLEIDEIGFER